MEFAQWPAWRAPASKAVMSQAGYCGLDAVGPDPIAPGALDANWAAPPSQTELEVAVYCAQYAWHGLIIMLAEGLILRALTCLALAFCSRGLRMDGPLTWAASRLRARRAHRAAAAAAGGAGV